MNNGSRRDENRQGDDEDRRRMERGRVRTPVSQPWLTLFRHSQSHYGAPPALLPPHAQRPWWRKVRAARTRWSRASTPSTSTSASMAGTPRSPFFLQALIPSWQLALVLQWRLLYLFFTSLMFRLQFLEQDSVSSPSMGLLVGLSRVYVAILFRFSFAFCQFSLAFLAL